MNKLSVIHDRTNWVTSHEQKEMIKALDNLSLPYQIARLPKPNSTIYLPDKYIASKFLPFARIFNSRVVFDYFHGQPSSSDISRQLLKTYKRHRNSIAAVRVSTDFYAKMIARELGEDLSVFKIPLGFDDCKYSPCSHTVKLLTKKELGIPNDSFVIGNFQKDDVGWNPKSRIPKVIKGPDILVEVLSSLKIQLPNLIVLLAGPSRNFVSEELKRFGVNYLHVQASDHEMPRLFHACDLYVNSTRDDGGPKGSLEALASGVPVVSTPVGQLEDYKHRLIGYYSAASISADSLLQSIAPVIEKSLTERFEPPSLIARSVSFLCYGKIQPQWRQLYVSI